MSPSESQLRAALSDGEGDGPDADTVIGKALAFKYERHRRRVRVAGVLGVVAVVGGVGIGLAATRGNDGRSEAGLDQLTPKHAAADQVSNALGTQRSAALPSAATAPGAVAGGAGQGTVNGPSTADPCPATPVHYLLAGGGGTDQFGAGEAMFAKPVAAITLCVYDNGRLRQPIGYSGVDATNLASTVESSQDGIANGLGSCVTAGPYTVEFLARATDGTALPPVEAYPHCSGWAVTNGTAVRSGWLPPAAVVALDPLGGPAAPTRVPGQESGSPAR